MQTSAGVLRLSAAPSQSCRLSANRVGVGVGGVSYAPRCINVAHVEQQRRDGRVTLQVDQAQAVGQVTLSGSHEKQPARRRKQSGQWRGDGKAERRSSVPRLPRGGDDGGVEPSVAGHGHGHGDDPAEGAQDRVPKGLQGDTRNTGLRNVQAERGYI